MGLFFFYSFLNFLLPLGQDSLVQEVIKGTEFSGSSLCDVTQGSKTAQKLAATVPQDVYEENGPTKSIRS